MIDDAPPPPVPPKEAPLAAVDRRLAVRRGKQTALMAVAQRLLVAIYHMLKHHEPYRAIGARPQSEPAKRKLAERMQRRIEQLGFKVNLEPAMPTAA